MYQLLDIKPVFCICEYDVVNPVILVTLTYTYKIETGKINGNSLSNYGNKIILKFDRFFFLCKKK